MILRAVILLAAMLLCAQAWAYETCRHARIETLCASLADRLAESMQVRVDRGASIMGVSFVNLHNMEQTSDLGRILSEQTANNFFQYGYQIVEPRLRSHSVTTHDENGEFALSRKLQHLDHAVDVQAFLTGTYAIADNSVAVSARIVSAQSKVVLAAAHCHLRLSPEIKQLLTPPPAAPIHQEPMRLLQLRNKADARQVQQALAAQGLYTGKVDGIWGKQSKAALMRFRSSLGLPATSDWNLETQSALLPRR